MAVYQALLLNTVVPQIQAAQAGDSYVMVVNATTPALRITQTGTGNAISVEDEANPDATPFVVTAAGDVGIGTNAPTSIGSSKVVEISSTAGNSGFLLFSVAGSLKGSVYANASETSIGSISATPLLLKTGDTTKATLDSSGNLGLGVTPSAWSSSTKAIDINTGGAVWAGTTGFGIAAALGGNYYWNTSNVPAYKTANPATDYRQTFSGQHQWYISTSTPVIGNDPSFTQAMTLDASGNLGIVTTSPSSFDAAARTLVVGTTSGSNGITIAAGSTGASTINFADGTAGGAQYAGYIDYQHNGDYMRFGTNGGTERARITSGGDLLVGTNSGQVAATVVAYRASAAVSCVGSWSAATSGDNLFQDFYTEATATLRGSIDYNRAGGLTRYNTTSDYRAKDVYGLLQNTGNAIDALKVYNGKMKGATQERPMLIAHEAQEVAPYAVSGEKDAVNADGTPKYQQMDVSSLVPLLIAEIQSLRARVAQLEAK